MIVAFTVFRRPFYLRETLESWKGVRGILDVEVAFHVDHSDQFTGALEICESFRNWHGRTTICTHNPGLGVSGNPFHALTQAFSRHAQAALAEEDVTVSSDVLEFYESALNFYPIACAWSDTKDGSPYRVEGRTWFNPWGWATDRAIWESVIKPTWDHDYSTADNRGPAGWDCNLGLRVLPDKGLQSAFTGQSRSQHIGKHLGVHQDPSLHGEQEMPASFVAERPPFDWNRP